MSTTDAQHGVSEWIGSLPGLGSAGEVWRAVAGVEDPGLDEAIGLLSDDSLLCDPVLQWCRAIAGDAGERITTARRAVIMLGVPAVRGAVLGISSAVALNSVRPENTLIDTDAFWTHAITVATLCEGVASGAGIESPGLDVFMLGGMLHDTGKLALAWADPERFGRAIDEAESSRRPTGACLREVFGVDHHTVAKQLAQRWGLGSAIRDAVWYQGQDPRGLPGSVSRVVPALITLSKARARAMHLGWSGEFGEIRSPDGGWERAIPGATSSVIERCEQNLHDVVRDRGHALGLGAGDPVAWSVSAALRRSAELAARLREASADAREARSVLDATEVFFEGMTPGSTPDTVVAAIGRSACGLLGVGRVAVVWQAGTGSAWRLGLIGADGRVERDREVTSPSNGSVIQRPADLGESHAESLLIASDLEWLARLIEHLNEAGTPILIGAGQAGEGSGDGASCLVLAPVPRATQDIESLTSIRSVWGVVLDGACRAHAADSLQEELAQANRALTETRDELAAKQSMVRLGQMAAGAAHELNNPLTVIRGRAQMIAEKASTPKQRSDAAAIAEAAQQVSDMVTSLHLLSIPPKARPRVCNPVLVLRDAVDRARSRVPESGARSRVRLNTDDLPDSMELDGELVAQALCEPIANALLAHPGGEVLISAESEAFTDRLKVRIIDRGPGLTPEASVHAFDPFFSDQPAGRRAGLGLARARSLIDLMHGRIDLGNNPGDIRGAYAEIVIPQGLPETRRDEGETERLAG